MENNEVLDFIEKQKLGFNLGNVIECVCKAGKTDLRKSSDDLDRAAFYLQRELKHIQELKQKTRRAAPTSANAASDFDKPAQPGAFASHAPHGTEAEARNA